MRATPTKKQLVGQILHYFKAAQIIEVVAPIYESKMNDGKWYHKYGEPFGAKFTGETRIAHYAFWDKKDNCYYGPCFRSAEDGEKFVAKANKEKHDEFEIYLEKSKRTKAELMLHLQYWEDRAKIAAKKAQ